VPFLFIYLGELIQGLKKMPKNTLGWLSIGSFFLTFLILVGYLFFIQKNARHEIFGGNTVRNRGQIFLKNIGIGILGCFIAYPLILLTSLLSGLISLLIWGKRGVSQLAVEQLKQALDLPLIYALLSILIVLIVPFIEELLFRGFLQSWLKNYLGRIGAILSTSFIFSLVHYSSTQGTGNFELMTSLFVLSCFIGFVFERQRTLWAPIALHGAFNAISILGITFSN
jgi:membrane protease YdiL (CAAX protease family)